MGGEYGLFCIVVLNERARTNIYSVRTTTCTPSWVHLNIYLMFLASPALDMYRKNTVAVRKQILDLVVCISTSKSGILIGRRKFGTAVTTELVSLWE